MLAAAVLVAAGTEATAGAEPAESEAVAEEALRRGDELRSQGSCEAAIASWRRGLGEVVHWAFLLRIGDCYGRLGRHEDAVAYLSRGLEFAGDELDAAGRAEVEATIGRSRDELPALVDVASATGGAAVFVDGVLERTTPVDRPLQVEPGEHEISLMRAGYAPSSTRVTARPGETASVTVELEPREQPVRAEPRARGRRLSPVWGSLLIALGAGLAGGGGYLASIDNERIDPEAVYGIDTLGPAVGMAALGTGLVVGGIVLLALPPRDRRPDRAWERGAGRGPGEGGAR